MNTPKSYIISYNLPYGNEILPININSKNIINLKFNKSGISKYINKDKNTDKTFYSESEQRIISNALENPAFTPKLEDLAYNKNNICILVSDISRPCPSYKFLPEIISRLKKAKVKTIKIIFGIGIHRKQTPKEQIELIGNIAAENCSFMDSNPEKCKILGTTTYGTPIEVFEEVLKSDFIIATGNIEYHYFAGYSGGAKALLPGVSSYNSITKNHSLIFQDNIGAGIFYNNPLRQDIEDSAKKLKIDFIFNVILDDSKKIVAAIAGKNNEAFIKGIKLYDQIYKITAYTKADIVLVSAGGYPKDINLYQAHKALENVKSIVNDNGKIILAAECFEGFGNETFAQWMQETDSFEKISNKIKEKFILGAHKAVLISKLLKKIKIFLYSNFDEQQTLKMGFKKIYDIQNFLNEEIKKDSNIKIAVVPNGRFVSLIT